MCAPEAGTRAGNEELLAVQMQNLQQKYTVTCLAILNIRMYS